MKPDNKEVWKEVGRLYLKAFAYTVGTIFIFLVVFTVLGWFLTNFPKIGLIILCSLSFLLVLTLVAALLSISEFNKKDEE